MMADDEDSECTEYDMGSDESEATHSPLQLPSFTWGTQNGTEFCAEVDRVFEETIHWRRNIFQIPSGSCGKAFVSELAQLFQAYGDGSS